ncbi:MAG TPA: DEAD/DEAH box helicase family protein, partial [Ureibacillus sp.]|nr:DEAD/DEAH box helicase family protein [Ureibacillus sp.]
MITVAEVIVDVAAYPVDRPFDYLVPSEMTQIIEIGCRVKVPFGPRNVLGFVVALKNETDVPLEKIKPVSELLDIEPVLTGEMLELAKWLKTDTICYEIDALQVMLPSALRAKYEKIVSLQTDLELLPIALQGFFGTSQQVNVKEFEKNNLLADLKQALKNKQLSIENIVKQKGKVKEVRKVQITENLQKLQDIHQQISNRAKKQKQLVEWMQHHSGEIIDPEIIYKEANASSQVLNAVIELGAASFIQQEVYRDPFTKDVQKTNFLDLTDEQSVALNQILTAIDEKQPDTFLLHGVTGSGKTEVYLQTISKVLSEGKEAIVLVPEISLTPQMTERFRSRFGELVAVMHSGLSVGEKYDEWRKIHQGKVKVVVGARSAVFAPFENVGIIILDEEH